VTVTAQTGLPRSLGRNVSVNYVAAAVAAATTLLLTPVLIHYLGASGYGAWTIVGSAIAYLELFELGFGVATIKFVAEDAGRDPAAVNRTISTNMAALAAFGVVALAVCLGVAHWIPVWFRIPSGLGHDAVVAFVIVGVALAVSIPADVLGGALAGHQRYDLLSLSNLALSVSTLVGGVLVVFLGGGLIGLAVVTASLSLLAQVLRWVMLKRIMPELRIGPSQVDASRLRLTAETSGWFLLRDLTNVVINRLDIVVVGAFLGVEAVAVYAVALKLSQLGQKALIPLVQVFFPQASALSVGGDRRAIRLLLIDGTRIALLVGVPITVMLTLLGSDAIQVWLGGSLSGAVPVLVVLAAARGLQSLADTAWWLLAGAGLIRTTSLVAVVESLVNVGLSVVLVQHMGVVGVAVGTLAGVAVVGTPAALWLGAHRTGTSMARIVRWAMLPHLAPAAASAGVLLAVRHLLPSGWPTLLVGGAAATVVYACVYLLSAPESDRAKVLRRLRRTSRGRSVGRGPVGSTLPVHGPLRVAVCVATRARPVGLDRLLHALTTQRLELADGRRMVLVVVVVDNDSGRDGMRVASRYASRLSITTAFEPRPGISHARNHAIRLVGDQADAYAFIDDDEVPGPDWLATLVEGALERGTGIVMGPVIPDYAPDVPPWVVQGGFHQRAEHPEGALLDYGRTSNVLVCAGAILAHSEPFPARMAVTGGEDTYFFARAGIEGHQISWSSGAWVTEHVPASRARLSWLVRREFRRGTTLSVCVRDLEPSALRVVLRVGGSVREISAGTVAVLWGAARGRAAMVHGVRRAAFGAGLLVGLSGWQIKEYVEASDDVA
jgi:succinoglycan biosynthesis protein ExoM